MAVTAAVAVIIARSIIKSRVALTQASFKAEEARLQTELKHANERNEELKKRQAEDYEALQQRFSETIAKVSAQMKAETGEMLKEREKAFSESSNASIGQIITPLKENIAQLKKAMDDNSKDQAERSGQMREQIRSLIYGYCTTVSVCRSKIFNL